MVLKKGLRPGWSPVMLAIALLCVLSGAAASATAQEPMERAQRRAEIMGPQATPTGWVGLSFIAPGPDGPASALRVVGVGADSPAERAGIRSGDLVVRWNGRSDVSAAIAAAALRPGDAVTLRLERQGESDRDLSLTAERRPPGYAFRTRARPGREGSPTPREFEIRMERLRDSLRVHVDSVQRRVRIVLAETDSVLGNIDVEEVAARARQRAAEVEARVSPAIALALAGGLGGIGGAQLTDVNDGLGSYFGVDEGALVLRVGPDTPAERAGLREGDVVVSAGDATIEGVTDLRRALNRAGNAALSIVVLRHGERIGLEIRPR